MTAADSKINKAQLNLYSADTHVGPKGVPE